MRCQDRPNPRGWGDDSNGASTPFRVVQCGQRRLRRWRAGLRLVLWRVRVRSHDRVTLTGYRMRPCGPGDDQPRPQASGLSAIPRPSLSHTANITVYFRSDNVGSEGLVFKIGSVREIGVP